MKLFIKYQKSIIVWIGIMVAFASVSYAQTQTVKGQILDADANYPLIGATIMLIGSDPILGTTTDMDGAFVLENVPIGRQSFAAQYVGYKTLTLPNVLVNSAKEVMLEIQLEESVESLEAIVITGNADKDLPINELAKVSARTFSLEEVLRYSGGRNDVSRLATSFAGVSAPNDSRNDIVVRGNSPSGLLWRVEGVPVATTNHFATLGTTGGPVNALNTNLLRTSDFITGAFPAEYGNANAAIFDVQYRNGNPDKTEFTGQLGFNGLEFMAEGPLNKKNGGSYLASYRYGIAGIAATGTSAVPYYQDLSFKINLGETKLGRFEFFGLNGASSIDFIGDEIDEDDLFADPNVDAFVTNQLGLFGVSHTIRLNQTTFLKTTLGSSYNANEFLQDNYVLGENGDKQVNYRATNVDNKEWRQTISTALTKKFNARWNLKAGILNESYNPQFFTEDRDRRVEIPDDNMDSIPDYFLTVVDTDERYNINQIYAQAEYKLSDNLSTTFGLHSQLLSINNSFALEPRAAISWQAGPKDRLSFAFGNHSQVAPAPILFVQEETANGEYMQTNIDLGFLRSNHYVLAYDRSLAPDWRLKLEAYYQDLYNIPVERTPSSYSILNEGADFVFDERGSLVNEGTGRNYGLEMTLEKFYSKGFYTLLTTSLYESLYTGSDGIERSTAFNNNYVLNVLGGKEWAWGRNNQNAWTIDAKFTTSGGRPYTPIDLEATRQNGGREILMEDQAFSLNYEDYFRFDLKFGVRLNDQRRNITHQFFVDLQNITNRTNQFARNYNSVTDEINVVEQIGFFPDILYRIQF